MLLKQALGMKATKLFSWERNQLTQTKVTKVMHKMKGTLTAGSMGSFRAINGQFSL